MTPRMSQPTKAQISAVMSHYGKMSKDVPKKLSAQEREARRARMLAVNAKRAARKDHL